MKTDEFIGKVVSLAPRIYPLVERLLGSDEKAKDAIQDTMLKLWKIRNKLVSHPNLQSFVFLTAKNHCLDILKRRKPFFEDIGQLDIRDQNRIDMEYEDQEHYNFIKEIIYSLPKDYREVMVLRDIDGLKYEEISAITGKSAEHLRVILSRARKIVATKILEIYNYERGTER